MERHAAWAVLRMWGLSSYVHFQGEGVGEGMEDQTDPEDEHIVPILLN